MKNEVVITKTLRGSFKKILWKCMAFLLFLTLTIGGIFWTMEFEGIWNVLSGLLAVAGGVGGLFVFFVGMIRKTRLVTVSDNGIDIPETRFIPWEDVRIIAIQNEGSPIYHFLSDFGWRQVVVEYACNESEKSELTKYFMELNKQSEETLQVKIDTAFSAYSLKDVKNILCKFYDIYNAHQTFSFQRNVQC